MFAYMEGHIAGPELEIKVKHYKKEYKSHRRVGAHE